MNCRCFVIVLLSFLLLLGCGKSSTTPAANRADANSGPPPAQADATPQVEASSSVRDGDTQNDESVAAPDDDPLATRDAPTEDTGDTDESVTPSAEALAATDEGVAVQFADDGDDPQGASPTQPDIPVNPPERMLLLTSQGPLIVDLTMWIDGLPFRRVMDRMIDEVIGLADADENGHTTWEELTMSSHFVYGQFGNVMISTEQQRQDVSKNYDINQNRRVDRNEVPGFLSQNAGSARIFALQSSDADAETSSSAVFRWLDVNGDRRLSADETASTAVRLRLLDSNDDDMLIASEIADDEPVEMERRVRRRQRYAQQSSLLLNDYTDWSSLLFLLEERYALGSPLTEDDFPLPGGLFGHLDEDESGQVDIGEMKHIQAASPHVALSIRFGSDSDAETPGVVVTGVHEALKPALQQSELTDRVTLKLEQVEVSIARDDRRTAGQAEALEMAWKQADADENEYLDESEYSRVQPLFNVPFQAVDSNGDSQVRMSEATVFLTRRGAAGRCRLQASAGVQADSLLSYLDRDNNLRLTTRELASASQMLGALDENQDGFLDSHEVPLAMTIQVSRGLAAGQPQTLPGSPKVRQSGDPSDWFFNMDTNRDGEISRNEFLGTDEVFERLDVNHDEFIDVQESQEESASNGEL